MYHYIYYFVLLLILFKICRESFHFEKISKFESVFLPIYSIVMFFITFTISTKNLIMLFFIIILSILISLYQSSDVEIKETTKIDRKNRPVFLIKKNKSYLIGWFLIIFSGIFIGSIINNIHLDSHHILEEFIEEIKRDAFIFYFFKAEASWYVWGLTGFSSYFFTRIIMKKETRLENLFKRRK